MAHRLQYVLQTNYRNSATIFMKRVCRTMNADDDNNMKRIA